MPCITSFTKKVNLRSAKHPLVFNGCLTNRGLTSLVKEATGHQHTAVSSLKLLKQVSLLIIVAIYAINLFIVNIYRDLQWSLLGQTHRPLGYLIK